MKLLILILILLVQLGNGQENLAPKFTDVVQQVFDGTLDGLIINGDVKATSKTDLSFEAKFIVKRDNSLGIEVAFKIEDGKCDYQNVKVTYGASILMGGDLKKSLDTICKFSSASICDDTSKIVVSEDTMVYNLLSTSNGAVLSEITLNTETLVNISQPVKSALNYLGAKAEIKILNPNLMVAGMNFSVEFGASALNPGSGICATAAASTICSNYEIDVENFNLGKEMLLWLRTNNNNYKNGEELSWLQPDGTFVIGTNSLSCLPTPGAFSFNVKGDDLADILGNTNNLRDALVKVANECLPSGYSISDNAFQNISITQNPDGTYTVNGLAYSGAAKDPAGVLAATRKCIEDNANDLVINGKTVKISGFEGDKNCAASRDRGSSNVCNTKSPPASQMRDGDQVVKNNDALDNKGNGNFNMVEVIIITIILTLLVVFIAYVGFVKYKNYKRRVNVSSENTSNARSNVDGVDHFERNSTFQLNFNPVNIRMNNTKTSSSNNAKIGNHMKLVDEENNGKVSSNSNSTSSSTSWEDVAIAKRNAGK